MRIFSIIVPVYFNELNLPETIPRLLALEENLPGYRLELVFVDDGSGDRSLAILQEYRQQFPDKIKVVKLTRNFGAIAAVQAGFTAVTGDCIGVTAADLQDPPELFIDMISHWEKGIKAVLAVRSDREEPFLQKLLANTYYACMRRFAIPDYPKGGFDFFLVDRQIAVEVNRIQEKNTNIMTLIFWLGHKHVLIPYVRRSRAKGQSRWTFSKKVKLFIDSFVAFSYLPIRALSVIGLVIAASAFIYGMVVVYGWFAYSIEVRGWASLMVLLAFTAGMQMAMLGVLGEYLWRTLDESRKRPGYVIDQIFAKEEK